MRRLIKYILMPFLVLVGFSRPMSAAMLPQVPLDFDSVSVSLITCYPGPEIYKLYGHTALRVRYGERDVMFNYGVFDFDSPNFMYRFVTGEAIYILARYDFDMALDEYRREHTRVVEQHLNLSEAAARSLMKRLLINAQPQNRGYCYNYIYDNCSTRARNIVESVLGSISYGERTDSLRTFRDVMHHFNSSYAWQQFGIDLALGRDLDVTMNDRDIQFAPIYLMKAFAGATYVDAQGERHPLVSHTDIILDGPETGSLLPPTPVYLQPLFFAILLFLLALAVTLHDMRHKSISRVFDTVLYALFGIAGLLVYFLIFVSQHAATSPNYVGLWITPLYFVQVVLLWVKRSWRFLYFYQMINFALLLVLIICGWCMPQQWNVAFYPLMATLALRQFNFLFFIRRYA